MEKLFIEFIVDKTVYYKNDSRWGVFAIRLKDPIEGVTYGHPAKTEYQYVTTLTGQVGKLDDKEIYDGEVTVVENDRFGKQLKAEYVKRKIIQGEEQILLFLKSFMPDKVAETVSVVYPNLINDVMNGFVQSLSNLPGVGKKMSDKIIENIKNNYALVDIIALLRPLGVTQKMIEKIAGFHKDPTVVKTMLMENPYELTKIHGLGFKKVDEIALKINPAIETSVYRVKAFITHVLKEEANNSGSTLIQKSILDAQIMKVIPCCLNIYMDFINEEKISPELISFVDSKIGLYKQKQLEERIFNKLKQLNSVSTYFKYNHETHSTEKIMHSKAELKREEICIKEAVLATNNKNGYELTPEQIDAVMNVVHNNVAIISGAAGTGKSSVIDCILRVFHGRSIEMCALAAKAAQRMMEITGRHAGTIHRLLGYQANGFQYNEMNQLTSDIFIIDEASMVNSYIFMALLEAIPVGAKIIIVFDYAQLPPIGAGNIASDLLNSQFSSVRFTKVHRQAEKSGILMDATKVRNGITPVDYLVAMTNNKRITHGQLQDMHYYFKDSKEEVNSLLINGFMSAIATHGLDNVYIVLPRKTTVINSTELVNQQIQSRLINSNMEFVSKGKGVIRKGARVIQRKNDYEKDVVNGEIGYMDDVDYFGKKFTIRFNENKSIVYDFDEIVDIELAYALTVHSFQGSQAKVILIGLDTTHFIMLDAFLLYTAITRAEKICMIVSTPDAFKACIKNTQQKQRTTFLQTILSTNNMEIAMAEQDYSKIDEFVDEEIEEV